MSLRPRLDGSADRRFHSGEIFTVSGLQLRVRVGSKKLGDLVIEWRTPSGWHAIEMDAVFLLADFMYENEHWLYPPPSKGGEYFLTYLRHAMKFGWLKSCAGLRVDKAVKNLTPGLFPEGTS